MNGPLSAPVHALVDLVDHRKGDLAELEQADEVQDGRERALAPGLALVRELRERFAIAERDEDADGPFPIVISLLVDVYLAETAEA